MFLVLTVGLLFSSCEKETNTVENFKVIIPAEASKIAYVGRALSFDVSLEASSGLQKAETRIDFQPVEESEQSDFASATTGTYHFTYTPTQFDLGKKLRFVVVAYDNQGHTSTATHEVTVEEAPVNIEIMMPDDAPSTVNLEESFEFDVSVISELDIVEISTWLNNQVIAPLTKTEFENPLIDSYRFAYTTVNDDAGTNLNFTIQVKDAEGKVKKVEYTVFVDGQRLPKPVQVFNDIMIGGQLNTENGHFLNTTTGSRHFSPGVAAISSSIDILGFVSGGATGVNLTAPSFSNATIVYSVAHSDAVNALAAWPVRNTTKLKRLTGVSPQDYNDIVMDNEIMALYDNGGEETDNINRIQVNDIIAFKTVEEKYGIILIKAPLPPNNRSSIIFDYKIQK